MKAILFSSLIFTLIAIGFSSCDPNANTVTIAESTDLAGIYVGTYQGLNGSTSIQSTTYEVTVTRISTNEVMVEGADFSTFNVTLAFSGSSASATNNTTTQFAYSKDDQSLTFQRTNGFNSGQFTGTKQ